MLCWTGIVYKLQRAQSVHNDHSLAQRNKLIAVLATVKGWGWSSTDGIVSLSVEKSSIDLSLSVNVSLLHCNLLFTLNFPSEIPNSVKISEKPSEWHNKSHIGKNDTASLLVVNKKKWSGYGPY